MKNFWLGVLASLIGGGLLWFGTETYTDMRASRAKIVKFEIQDHATLITPDIRKIIKTLDDGDSIATVRYVNEGRNDLENPEFRISSKIYPSAEDIVSYGLKESVGEKTELPNFESNGQNLIVKYPILRPGEGGIIWIAHRGPEIFQISNSQPGLILDEKSPFDESDEDWWGFLAYIGLALGSLVLGIALAEWGNREVLRKIGFDPDEVAKVYTELQKKKN